MTAGQKYPAGVTPGNFCPLTYCFVHLGPFLLGTVIPSAGICVPACHASSLMSASPKICFLMEILACCSLSCPCWVESGLWCGPHCSRYGGPDPGRPLSTPILVSDGVSHSRVWNLASLGALPSCQVVQQPMCVGEVMPHTDSVDP